MHPKLSKYPEVKKFLFSNDGLTVYENLTFDLQKKGIPTLHWHDELGKEMGNQS